MKAEIRFRDWYRKDPRAPRLSRTYTDPCAACGSDVHSMLIEAITVISNPAELIRIPDPNCQYEEGGSADCTCRAISSMRLDPSQNITHVVDYQFTLSPCGHMHTGTRKFYEESKAEPGTLGALYEAWTALDV